MIEGVAQDGAANGLQLRRDITHTDGIFGLHGHVLDVRVNSPQLPYGEARERRAKQQKCAKAAVQATANSGIEKRHWISPCVGLGELKLEK